jgi:hypothetical protein
LAAIADEIKTDSHATHVQLREAAGTGQPQGLRKPA